MKNKLVDLNDHLFAQLERLSDEDLTGDQNKLCAEIERSKAVAQVAQTIIGNARLVLDAQVAITQHQLQHRMPMLEYSETKVK